VRSAKLVRSEFEESTAGLTGALLVRGETTYQYKGDQIVKANSVVKSSGLPPRVDESVKTYTYDPLGRLATSESYGMVTRYRYDPFGRPLGTDCVYESPDGTFTSEDHSNYSYAPPQSEPVMPSNGLFMAITEARSGPVHPERPLGIAGPVQGLRGAVGAVLAKALPPKPDAEGLLEHAKGKLPRKPSLLEQAAQLADSEPKQAHSAIEQMAMEKAKSKIPANPALDALGKKPRLPEIPVLPQVPELGMPELKKAPDVTRVEGTYVYG
jgi:YD repeat-containing protein